MNTRLKLSVVILFVAAGCGGGTLPKEKFPPKRLKLGANVPKFELLDNYNKAKMFEAPFERPLIILSTKIGFEYELGAWIDLVRKELGPESKTYSMVVAVRAPTEGLVLFSNRLGKKCNILSDINGCERLKKYFEASELLARERIIRLDDENRADDFITIANAIKNDLLTTTSGLADTLSLVGEGPHVIVISKIGELLGQLDGPADSDRPEQFKKILKQLAP